MARIRQVKPELFDDPDIGALPIEARWLFIGLLTQADRRGRLIDDPRRLKARLFPYDNIDVDAALTALATAGFVARYEVDGRRYVQVRSFEKHQRPHPKEPESTIPPNPQQNGANVERNGEPWKETASRAGSSGSSGSSFPSGSLGTGSSGSSGAGSLVLGSGSSGISGSSATVESHGQTGKPPAPTSGQGHERCVQPCGRICFPRRKLSDFVRGYSAGAGASRQEAVEYVRTWVTRVSAEWTDGPKATWSIPHSAEDFWQERWLEDVSARRASRSPRRVVRGSFCD